MSDLRNAIEWVRAELAYDLELGLAFPEPASLVVEAARSWADLMEQEPIWWCMTHGRTDDTGLDCSMVYDCRMVRVRLAQEEPQ